MFERRDRVGSNAALMRQAVLWAQRIAIGSVIGTGLASFVIIPALGRADTAASGVAAEVLLERARAQRETLSPDFAGFRSKLRVWTDGKAHHGQMTFRPPITLEVEVGDADVTKAVKRTVRSLLAHRMAPTRSRKRTNQTISYAEEDIHPLGRRILLGDKYGSSYRIRENRILEVDRNLEDSRLLITVMDTQATREGTYLPTHFFVVTFDKESGAVKQGSAYADVYQEVGGEFLPKSRQIVSTAEGRTETLRVEWRGIELLSPANTD